MDRLEKRIPLRLTKKMWEQLQALSKLHSGNATEAARVAIQYYYQAKREELKEMD